MQASGTDHDGRVGVSGTVTSDGVPAQNGRIHFSPDTSTEGPDAWGTIEGGRYRISRENGPVPGIYRVSIEIGPSPTKQGFMETRPKKQRVVMRRTVSWPDPVMIGKDGSRNRLDIELPLRTPE